MFCSYWDFPWRPMLSQTRMVESILHQLRAWLYLSNINLTIPTTEDEAFPHQTAPAESQINPSQPTILSELTDPLTRQLQVSAMPEPTKTEKPSTQDVVLKASLDRCRGSATQTDHSRFCHSPLRRSHDLIQGPWWSQKSFSSLRQRWRFRNIWCLRANRRHLRRDPWSRRPSGQRLNQDSPQ